MRLMASCCLPCCGLRPSCAYELRPEDIVVGVWTSKATESKVAAIMDTWGKKVPLELLGSGG